MLIGRTPGECDLFLFDGGPTMCKKLPTAEFRKKLIEVSGNKDPEMVYNYLVAGGYIIGSSNGHVEAVGDIENKVLEMTKNPAPGDIVWDSCNGLLMVMDVHPKVCDDGHHFRAIGVTTNAEGKYVILGETRSMVVEDASVIRVRHTSFDMDEINKLSKERSDLVDRIHEINHRLSSMTEVNQCQAT